MSQIKICFFTREYSHEKMGKTGGIGVFLKQFTAALKAHEFDITVVSFGEKAVRFNDAGVDVIKINDLSVFNERIKAPLRRYKVPGYISIKLFLEFINRLYISLYVSLFVWRRKFDLIEFHDYGGDAPYFFGKPPKIVRCHGSALTLHHYMGYVHRISDAIFEKKFFRRFYHNVVAVSEYAAYTTQQAFKLKNKPLVIYNGVTINMFGVKQKYLEGPTIPYSIFYFGSIRERKGINIACQVFNNIIEVYPDATFHLLGNNNNDYWNTNAKHILTENALKRTSYYGTIPNDKINDYLQQAHVVLFPSFGENFSIALLEVMALGKLVVTSNIPAFREIIEPFKNGFIAKTELDFVTHVINIFKNSVPVEEISNQAVLTIKNNYNIDNIIQQNINYYKALL